MSNSPYGKYNIPTTSPSGQTNLQNTGTVKPTLPLNTTSGGHTPQYINTSGTQSFYNPFSQNSPTTFTPSGTQTKYSQPTFTSSPKNTIQTTQFSQPHTSQFSQPQFQYSQPQVHQYSQPQTQTITQPIIQKPNTNPPILFGQVNTTLQKNTKDLTKEDLDTLSKAGKDMFTNAFSKSSTVDIYGDMLEQVKHSGQKFKDPEFPANIKSLLGGLTEAEVRESGNDVDWKNLVWLRPDEIYGKGKYKVFYDSIEPNDIKQGSLGDCYFLSTLASIAENSDRIRKLFVSDQVNEYGLYGIKVCDVGEWKTVLIDDLIPCLPDTKEPVFTRGNGSEIWVLLLEKAWAKIYGGYARIESGLTRECLHDLTGGPTKFYQTGNPNVNETIWTEIYQGEQKNFIMTAGAGDFFEGADLLDSCGLVGSHAYSLLSVHDVVDKEGVEHKLVKLRNPWGQSEWNGDWSDNSTKWTPELKTKLGLQNRDDGIFFMAFDDFLQYFSDAQICKAHDDYLYKSLKVKAAPNHATYFKVQVKKAGHYYLTANQESKRKHLPSEDYHYSEIAIVFAKKNGKDYEYVEGFQRTDKEVWTDGELQPGEYIVYVKVDWNQKHEKEFALGIYGVGEVTIEKIPKSYCPDFLEKTYQFKGRTSKKLESYAYYNVADCYRAVELTDDGFGFVYYKNNSKVTLEEELYFKVMEGLKLRKPFRGNSIKVLVKPGEEKCVVTKVVPDAKKIRQAFTEKVRFF
jgi:calpain-15